jgi:hypothetical protein
MKHQEEQATAKLQFICLFIRWASALVGSSLPIFLVWASLVAVLRAKPIYSVSNWSITQVIHCGGPDIIDKARENEYDK